SHNSVSRGSRGGDPRLGPAPAGHVRLGTGRRHLYLRWSDLPAERVELGQRNQVQLAEAGRSGSIAISPQWTEAAEKIGEGTRAGNVWCRPYEPQHRVRPHRQRKLDCFGRAKRPINRTPRNSEKPASSSLTRCQRLEDLSESEWLRLRDPDHLRQPGGCVQYSSNRSGEIFVVY